MFGFRLKAKSEHEATDVFGWYDVGVGMVYAWRGDGRGNLLELRREDNDAARRVATSLEKRENRFKPPYSKRGTAAKGP